MNDLSLFDEKTIRNTANELGLREVLPQVNNTKNDCIYTVKDLSELSGYSIDALTNGKDGILYKSSFVEILKAHSMLGGYHNTQKFYDSKVLEALKRYQLKAHGNMKNAEVANNTTESILQNASQMLDLQVIAESGNVEAMQQFMKRMVTYTQSVHEAKEAQQRAEIAEQKLIEQAPKVDFFDDVTGSSDTIDMKEVAKVLNIKGIGRNKLFEILRNKKILDRNNQPYQKYVDAGYFRIIESRYALPTGDIKINLKTVVFQKGLDYIRKCVA